MPRQFIDLSITLCNDVVSDPPFMRPKIEYVTHAETMREANHFFPDVAAEQMPGGEGFRSVDFAAPREFSIVSPELPLCPRNCP